ncbi:zinc finger protein 33B-like [Engraulis encrasicolus]|uniref:zinc finger protein 33B-like n=1 Tax=Engraulis encrasicolus TaxID=184585 RepID=UPI002FD683FC
MLHQCAVDGCPNKSDTIIHYILPEEPIRRQQWVDFLRRQRSADISRCTRICSSHFSEDSFTKLDLGFTKRLILNVNAVPSIYTDVKAVLERSHANETPLSESPSESESGITVCSTVSLACIKKEPGQDEQSCDAMSSIKEEPMEDDGYGDSSSNHLTEDEMQSFDGNILKVEATGNIDIDDGKPFHCLHCGEGFQNKAVLQQHEMRHKTLVAPASTTPAAEKTYECQHCGKVFSHKGFLKAHEKIHASMATEMAFACKECNRRFLNNSSLKKHMRNHLKHLKYPCPVCGEEFEMKGSLHVHIKQHPGEKLRCKYCNSGFWKMDAYLKHLDCHTVITPYYCPKCKLYQRTERGFQLHQTRCPMRDPEVTMIVKDEDEEEVVAKDGEQEEVIKDAEKEKIV